MSTEILERPIPANRGGPGRPASIPTVCPHLGLASDPHQHVEQTSPEHRCYLWMQRDRIDVLHQERFCLTAAHPSCPWLSALPPGASARELERSWWRFGVALRIGFLGLEKVSARASLPAVLAAMGAFGVRLARALGPVLLQLVAVLVALVTAGCRRASGLLRRGGLAAFRAVPPSGGQRRRGPHRAPLTRRLGRSRWPRRFFRLKRQAGPTPTPPTRPRPPTRPPWPGTCRPR
jgi:hypothetical protein